MKITPIGIYGPYPKAGEASSCYLVESAQAKVVLDFGSGALSKISEILDPTELDAILLTHLHFDHFVDVLPLAYALNKQMPLYCPATPVDNFSLIKNRVEYEVRVINSSSEVWINDMRFEFLHVKHPVETYAIKVIEGEKSFVYTGDIMEIGEIAEFCKNSEFVLCDCAGNGSSPHLTPKDGENLMKRSKARVIMTHVSPKVNMQDIAKLHNLELITAGQVYKI